MHACQFLARSCGGTLANAAGGGGDGEGLAHQQSLPFDRETLETPCSDSCIREVAMDKNRVLLIAGALVLVLFLAYLLGVGGGGVALR